MRFDLSQYETVQQRLDAFHAQYPTGRVITTLIESTATRYIIVATIFKHETDEFPCATGHAEETVGSTPVNKTSAIENCETSAIGRALRNAGIGREASREEMQKVERGNTSEEEAKQLRIKQKEIVDLALASGTLEELRSVWQRASEDTLNSQFTWAQDGQKRTTTLATWLIEHVKPRIEGGTS